MGGLTFYHSSGPLLMSGSLFRFRIPSREKHIPKTPSANAMPITPSSLYPSAHKLTRQFISRGENLCGRVPALGVLLADVGDGKTWRFVLEMCGGGLAVVGERTRGKRLLELLGLVGVLEDEGVDVPRAADLELDVVDLLVLLDARGWMVVSFTFNFVQLSCQRNACPCLQPQFQAYAPLCFRIASCRLRLPKVFIPSSSGVALHCAVRERAEPHVHWASLRRQISMNCLISETSAGILAAVDGRVVKNLKVRWKFAKGRSGQIVVVSLRKARAAKGRCRVRIRRGMAEREVGRLWRRKPRQLATTHVRVPGPQHSTALKEVLLARSVFILLQLHSLLILSLDLAEHQNS